jgi:hypothetical protein
MRVDDIYEEYKKDGTYLIRAMTYESHSPPHELRAFLSIPEVKKELDKLRFVIKNTPPALLNKIPRAEIVDTLLKQNNFNISPRGKELVYNYLKGNDQYLKEESPESFNGSMSDDQILSRLWMSKKLAETKVPIKSVAVLGSWYGILPYVLTRNNKIDKIHAVDLLNDALTVSKKLNPNTKHYCADANKLKYDNVDCVVNPSINNIVGNDWYNNIPKGKLCLFQTENVAVEKGCPQNLQELIKKYPLKEYLYQGTLKSSDKDGKLLRSMTIGYK